jgi:hypothetical protein
MILSQKPAPSRDGGKEERREGALVACAPISAIVPEVIDESRRKENVL